MEQKEESFTEPLHEHPINTGEHAANDVPPVVIFDTEDEKCQKNNKNMHQETYY